MATDKEMKFDIQIVGENFQAAVYEEDDVYLQFYLQSYEELNNFICTDIKEKLDILNDLLKKSENSDVFRTVKGMIEYEKNNELLNKEGYISGSRTLLRLHRGLDFIQIFLKKLGDLQEKEGTSGACRIAYDLTLAKFHPFLIRTGARVAIYTLPTKDILLKRVCGDEEENIRRAITYLPQTLQATSVIYKRIEQLYAIHDLHELP